jgi:hypothetical protein
MMKLFRQRQRFSSLLLPEESVRRATLDHGDGQVVDRHVGHDDGVVQLPLVALLGLWLGRRGQVGGEPLSQLESIL